MSALTVSMPMRRLWLAVVVGLGFFAFPILTYAQPLPPGGGGTTVVDCAQGGQAMAEWVDPMARPWTEADRRLMTAHVSPKQVQVVWIKLANITPEGLKLDDSFHVDLTKFRTGPARGHDMLLN